MNLIKVAFGMLLIALCIMLGSIRQRDDYVLESVSEPVSNDKPDTAIHTNSTILNSKGAILEFLNKGNFTYSESKNHIPKIVLDSIFKANEYHFKFRDKNTREYFAGSYLRFPPSWYGHFLKFVAYNDSTCLISYVQGGSCRLLRTVEFFKYKGDVKRTALNINDYEPSDILMLKTFLTEYPNITKLKQHPYSDNNIYIKDSNYP